MEPFNEVDMSKLEKEKKKHSSFSQCCLADRMQITLKCCLLCVIQIFFVKSNHLHCIMLVADRDGYLKTWTLGQIQMI